MKSKDGFGEPQESLGAPEAARSAESTESEQEQAKFTKGFETCDTKLKVTHARIGRVPRDIALGSFGQLQPASQAFPSHSKVLHAF